MAHADPGCYQSLLLGKPSSNSHVCGQPFRLGSAEHLPGSAASPPGSSASEGRIRGMRLRGQPGHHPADCPVQGTTVCKAFWGHMLILSHSVAWSKSQGQPDFKGRGMGATSGRKKLHSLQRGTDTGKELVVNTFSKQSSIDSKHTNQGMGSEVNENCSRVKH